LLEYLLLKTHYEVFQVKDPLDFRKDEEFYHLLGRFCRLICH